ncbi:hypothetical protein GQ457_12G027490 [Hibiscus cannabinus]
MISSAFNSDVVPSTEYKEVFDKYVKLPNGELVRVSHIGCVRLFPDLVLTNNAKTMKEIGLAKICNGLYHLQLTGFPIESVVSCNVSSVFDSSSKLWHARLGHPSKQRMRFFVALNSQISISNDTSCNVCHLAKHKRLPFPISQSTSAFCFDLVHIDIWEPFPVKSFYGHSYFLTIVDDKSRDVVFCEDIFPFQKDTTADSVVLPACKNQCSLEDFLIKSVNKDVIFAKKVEVPVEQHINDGVLSGQCGSSEHTITPIESVSADNSSSVAPNITDAVSSCDTLNVPPIRDSVTTTVSPARSRKLPQHLKDYQVDIPKVRKSSHTVAQVMSYQNFSTNHLSYIANVEILSEPKNYKQAALSSSWQKAMEEELIALDRNKTWEIVSLPPGKQAIGCKWVYKTKLKSDGTLERYKARLVAKGYTQQPGIGYFDTFSHVAKITTIRTLLTVAATNNWFLEQLDVNNAFLHGFLNEEVYMLLPPGVSYSIPNAVCKLNKSLYGLKQASQQWNERLTTALSQQGFRQAKSDASLFNKGEGYDFIALLIYVDDVPSQLSDACNVILPYYCHLSLSPNNRKVAASSLREF